MRQKSLFSVVQIRRRMLRELKPAPGAETGAQTAPPKIPTSAPHAPCNRRPQNRRWHCERGEAGMVSAQACRAVAIRANSLFSFVCVYFCVCVCHVEGRELPSKAVISNTGQKEKRGRTEPPTASSVASLVPGTGMTGPCTQASPAFSTLHSTQGTCGGPLATAN